MFKDTHNPNTYLNLDKTQWGWISTVTNGLSVVFQLNTLIKTKSAESFSMNFIWLMTFLNFMYFLYGVIDGNVGLALATAFFVLYNLYVIYVHHCGKGSNNIQSMFHTLIQPYCRL